MKVIVNDISEIWSLDLAYVDKLAKYNRGVLHFLIAVDYLPRYLQVEPLKTKSAKKQQSLKESSNRQIQHSQ